MIKMSKRQAWKHLVLLLVSLLIFAGHGIVAVIYGDQRISPDALFTHKGAYIIYVLFLYPVFYGIFSQLLTKSVWIPGLIMLFASHIGWPVLYALINSAPLRFNHILIALIFAGTSVIFSFITIGVQRLVKYLKEKWKATAIETRTTLTWKYSILLLVSLLVLAGDCIVVANYTNQGIGVDTQSIDPNRFGYLIFLYPVVYGVISQLFTRSVWIPGLLLLFASVFGLPVLFSLIASWSVHFSYIFYSLIFFATAVASSFITKGVWRIIRK